MTRFHRFAAWVVVGLGALTTIATSHAPTTQLVGNFDRTLAAGEAVHVTFHVSQPAMDHLRASGGTLRFRAQTSTTGFRLVPDVTDPPLVVADGGAAGALVTTCPTTGACDVGVTLEGPAEGEDAVVRVFLDATIASQSEFPAGATLTAEED